MLKIIQNQDAAQAFQEHKRCGFDLTKLSLEEINNPVGYLQELLQKTSASLPLYSHGSETSSPFSCSVTLNAENISAHGFGNKKSEAKMNAAMRMLQILKEEMLAKVGFKSRLCLSIRISNSNKFNCKIL